MKVVLIRLSSFFPSRRHLNPLMIMIALIVLVPIYAIFGETIPAAVSVGIAVIVITMIGLKLPKRMLFTKWAFYEAAVFTAFVPVWMCLSKNSDDLGWWSLILMILTAFAAGIIMMWTKSRPLIKKNR